LDQNVSVTKLCKLLVIYGYGFRYIKILVNIFPIEHLQKDLEEKLYNNI